MTRQSTRDFCPQNHETDEQHEYNQRKQRVGDLIEQQVANHPELWHNKEQRLAFVGDSEAMLRLITTANATMRGKTYNELQAEREAGTEVGASLGLLSTPPSDLKLACFKRGQDAISEYIESSDATIDEKLDASAMAYEALIIWTHAFNDGNGRASRFTARLIEAGGEDVDDLTQQTAAGMYRQTHYDPYYMTKQAVQQQFDNPNLMLSDEERADLKAEIDNYPDDEATMYKNVAQLLRDTEGRAKMRTKQHRRQERIRNRENRHN